MLQKTAKFFLYAAIASPLIVNKSLFFPFITGKALFFRSFVELALVSFIGAVAFGYIRKDAVMRVIRQPLFIAVAVFTALFILTCFTAVNPSYAFWSNFERGEGGWQILHYFLFFGLLSLLFSSEKEWRGVMGWQVIVSSLVALYAVGQAVDWPAFVLDPPTGALSGTLGNPSYLGGYLMFSMLLALWLAFTNKKHISWLWLLLAIFQLMVFFTAKTRGSFIALGIGIIIMAVLWARQHAKSKYVTTSIAIALFFIILGISYLVTTVKGDAWAGLQPRFWTWKSALSGIIEKPLFGWGIENFPFIFDRYYDPRHYDIQSWFDRAHNTFLEYATSGGIPLLLAYMAIFYVLYYRLYAVREAKWWPFFAAMPAMYLINGLVLFEILPLYLILFLLFAFHIHYTNNFTLHYNNSARRAYVPQPAVSPALYSLFAISVIIITLSLYFTAYLPFQKNRRMLIALKPNNKTDRQIFTEYESALSFYSPIGENEATQILIEFTEVYIDFLKKNLKVPVPPEKIKEVIDFNEMWYEKNKSALVGVKPLYAYARTLVIAARATNDAHYLKRAHELINEGEKQAPNRIEFVKLALQAAEIEKDQAAYKRALEKGKSLRPDLKW